MEDEIRQWAGLLADRGGVYDLTDAAEEAELYVDLTPWIVPVKVETDDVNIAGANIPWWLAAISFWMATFSSLSFVTYAELGYKYGLTALVLYCLTKLSPSFKKSKLAAPLKKQMKEIKFYPN